jgi:hypothetical protein
MELTNKFDLLDMSIAELKARKDLIFERLIMGRDKISRNLTFELLTILEMKQAIHLN